jgi:hypothetical protein
VQSGIQLIQLTLEMTDAQVLEEILMYALRVHPGARQPQAQRGARMTEEQLRLRHRQTQIERQQRQCHLLSTNGRISRAA